VFRLAVALLAIAALIAVYRALILSDTANTIRRVVRRVVNRRDRIPRWKRLAVWAGARGHCRTCHRWTHYRWTGSPDSLEVDHVTPWSWGGSDSIHNLTARCRACNAAKGAKWAG
jgi:5-methylcytosine-specific restriction endonuclease McrA